MGRFLVGAAAGSEGPPRCGERRRGGSEHAPSAQLGNVGQVDAGEFVEKVGLGGADAVRGSLGAGAKGAADGHADHRKGGAAYTEARWRHGFIAAGPCRTRLELNRQLTAANTVIASLHHNNQMLRTEHQAEGNVLELPPRPRG
ncbi:hypothetical protein [Streptomyces sp. NPDC047453]|uniref:hypothetical protein n=1 Tax=Streptomyces sp. NPDC047453 TaxID=3154812 RepID=UPI0033FF37C6